MKFLPLLVVLAVLVSACSTSEYIPLDQVKARSFSLNTRATMFPVSVSLPSDPMPRDVNYFSIVGDSALWITPTDSTVVSIPWQNLQSITINDKQKGLIDGAFIGFGVGLIAGSVAYAINSDDISPAVISGSTLLGGLIGEIAGLLIGADVHYYFGPPPAR